MDLIVRSRDELHRAIEDGTKHRNGALFVIDGVTIAAIQAPILELALGKRIPVISQFREFVVAGGLMVYGPSPPEMYRSAAAYVDKILKGAKPADLPVEQPTKFELIVNRDGQGARDQHSPIAARASRRGHSECGLVQTVATLLRVSPWQGDLISARCVGV